MLLLWRFCFASWSCLHPCSVSWQCSSVACLALDYFLNILLSVCLIAKSWCFFHLLSPESFTSMFVCFWPSFCFSICIIYHHFQTFPAWALIWNWTMTTNFGKPLIFSQYPGIPFCWQNGNRLIFNRYKQINYFTAACVL